MPGLVSLALVLVAAAFLLYGHRMAGKARRSQSWHPTTGTVTRSDVELERGHKNSVYKARIAYTYSVGGREYSSDTICAGGTLDTSARSRAEKRCRKYPHGARVPVFYDPNDPAEACLEQRAEGTLVVGAIGAVLALAGLLNFVGIVRFD